MPNHYIQPSVPHKTGWGHALHKASAYMNSFLTPLASRAMFVSFLHMANVQQTLLGKANIVLSSVIMVNGWRIIGNTCASIFKGASLISLKKLAIKSCFSPALPITPVPVEADVNSPYASGLQSC